MLKVFDLTETELKRLADVSNLFFPTSSQLSQENRIRMKYGIHIREAREKNHQCEDWKKMRAASKFCSYVDSIKMNK